jgi:hypothetical protein
MSSSPPNTTPTVRRSVAPLSGPVDEGAKSSTWWAMSNPESSTHTGRAMSHGVGSRRWRSRGERPSRRRSGRARRPDRGRHHDRARRVAAGRSARTREGWRSRRPPRGSGPARRVSPSPVVPTRRAACRTGAAAAKRCRGGPRRRDRSPAGSVVRPRHRQCRRRRRPLGAGRVRRYQRGARRRQRRCGTGARC